LTEGVYDEIKRRLVDAGMLAGQVEYIHDATTDERKIALYARVNAGQCRVLIGSTTKMGTGLNVQSRIIAIHHLTAPWRPDWLEQANGRGRRQGNMWSAIHICAYVTQRSYDSCIWQMLEQKSRFISQIASGTYSSRTADDIGDLILTASMAKAIALGNPAVLDKIRLETELTQAERQYKSWAQQQARARHECASLPADIADQEQRIASLRAMIADLESGEKPAFSVKLREIGGDRWQTFDDLVLAETHLGTLAHNMHKMTSKTDILVGQYRGMTLSLRRKWAGIEMIAVHRSGIELETTVQGYAAFRGIEYQVSVASGRLSNLEANLAISKRRLEVLGAQDAVWTGRDRVTQLLTAYRTACEAVTQEGIVDARTFHFGDLRLVA
jgi:hypothetical protein